MSAPNDVFGLSELIEGFTFRNQGGIKILKKWREEAVIMQLDVEIVSVARNQFVNYRSLPASGSYGYATLVFRDFCLPSIQLTQSRQTIYYATNEFAQAAWMEFHQMVRLQENFKGIEELVCFNTGLLGGACIAKECKPIPQPSFIEFPLREVFVKADLGTQFKVELSYWKINDVLDNCGNLVSPKSNQNDADKDEGLPPFGSAPQIAPNPSSPFAGLPPASTSDREGVISDDRINDLDTPNPDNFFDEPATSTTEGWYIELDVAYLQTEEGLGVRGKAFFPSSRNSVINVAFPNSDILTGLSACGTYQYQLATISITETSVSYSVNIRAGATQNSATKFGLLPPNQTQSMVDIICT